MARGTKTKIVAEYIWIDGKKPTAKLRNKPRIINGPVVRLDQIPKWGFDGSSTGQAKGNFSDCLLEPVCFVHDPIRKGSHILVLCEVLKADGTPHASNTRAVLRTVSRQYVADEPWAGIEQEYTLYEKNRPAGWPKEEGSFPHPQGRYYCGVGADEVCGRPLVERHMFACLEAGLALEGTNAEVMPGQWEFQIGCLSPLEVSDQLWIARWLLYRLGEEYGLNAKLDPKPMPGDWNGAGGHVNFSTRATRARGGLKKIETACELLKARHREHIAVYGSGNKKRLTGKHETCSIREFRAGVSDRGASIRIPAGTARDNKGYFEDRRPAANLDPYKVFTALLETVCGKGFDPAKHGWKSDVRI